MAPDCCENVVEQSITSARPNFGEPQVAKAAFGLHSFGEIDLPVHLGYLISVSPTVSQHVKCNKTK
jgi:hypothetical protein